MKPQHELRNRTFVERPVFERCTELWQTLDAAAERRRDASAVASVEVQ